MQPQTFITRVREHSTLSPLALSIAVAIAEHRFRKRLKPDEPLALSLVDLARYCHMGRTSVVRYLAECVDSGWIKARTVYRDGRQQPSEYLLGEPEPGSKPSARRRREPMPDAARERLEARRTESVPGTTAESVPADAVSASIEPITEYPGAAHIAPGATTVVRSNNYVPGGAAPQAQAQSRDGQDEQVPAHQPPPDPASRAARVDHGDRQRDAEYLDAARAWQPSGFTLPADRCPHGAELGRNGTPLCAICRRLAERERERAGVGA